MLSEDLREYANKLKKAVLDDEKMAAETVSRKSMYTFLLMKSAESNTFVPVEHREAVISNLLNLWYSYGNIQGAIDDPYVTDIHLIGTTTIIKRNGTNFESSEFRFDLDKDLVEFVERKLENTPYSYSLAEPITDAILPDGYRLNVIGGPSTRYTVERDGNIITEPRTIVTIRKPIYPFSLDDLVNLNMFNEDTREYFRLMQLLGDSFIVAGGVNSAKTTLMNALTGDIPKGYVNLIIEELAEMTPLGPWFIRLTNRDENYEGKGAITMDRNIINSLRMDCDNEYIGEVRGPQVAYQFLRMSLIVKRQTGTTFHTNIGHDNGINGVLTRFILEATEGAGAQASYANTASMVANKIRHIITLRDTKHGKRLIEVGEVVGYDFREKIIKWIPAVSYNFKKDDWVFHGISPAMAERAENEGLDIHLKVSQEAPNIFYIA